MDEPAFETVRVHFEGSVGRITLNRPEKLNPLSTHTLEEIAGAAAATKELVMTYRRFDATEALRLGLVNRVVSADRLGAEVESVAATLASKAAFPLQATKRHVDAITAAMVGIGRTWSDADALVTARRDPECQAAAASYLERLAANRR